MKVKTQKEIANWVHILAIGTAYAASKLPKLFFVEKTTFTSIKKTQQTGKTGSKCKQLQTSGQDTPYGTKKVYTNSSKKKKNQTWLWYCGSPLFFLASLGRDEKDTC